MVIVGAFVAAMVVLAVLAGSAVTVVRIGDEFVRGGRGGHLHWRGTFHLLTRGVWPCWLHADGSPPAAKRASKTSSERGGDAHAATSSGVQPLPLRTLTSARTLAWPRARAMAAAS